MIQNLPNGLKVLIILLFLGFGVYAQKGGTVTGTVTDKLTDDPLPGATVSIKGTTQGVVTDLYGNFSLYIPNGSAIIEIRYIGYGTVEQEVTITDGKTQELDISLDLNSLLTEEIVITGQAVGQAAAINQQINANTIVNIVSQDKIRELPDQNAAETLGRLPGISVRRSGGEGNQVVMRGLSPRFSSITINGERIPASGNDRSVDISMMSPDVLAGIEVFKSLTPDKDADAIGGTVNFKTKRASEDPEFTGYFQYGYNALANEWGQIRTSATGSKRFLDGRVGVLVTGNYQKANRSQDSELLGWGGAQFLGDQRTYNLDNISLRRTFRNRYRYGGAATIDYEFSPQSRIVLNSLLQYRTDEEDQYISQYTQARTEYRHNMAEETERVVSTSLTGTHSFFKNWNLEWRASYNLNEGDRPLEHSMRFWDIGGSDGKFNTSPNDFFRRAVDTLHVLEQSLLARVQNIPRVRETENVTAQFDLTIPVTINDKIGGSIKFGGKFRQDSRLSNETGFLEVGMENSAYGYSWLDPEQYERAPGGNVIINSFLSPLEQSDWNVSSFPFGVGSTEQLPGYHISASEVRNFYNQYRDSIYAIDPQRDFEDYTATDRITSGYLMGTLKYENLVTVVGGIRAENTYLRYNGFFGTAANVNDDGLGGGLSDTTRTRSYLEWFPQVNVKIQPRKWFDVRLAATKSLTRPNFLQLVPFSRRNEFEKRLDRGNFDLQHTTAWNYDAFLSFYSDWGLLTVGGFYKELTNIDYQSNSRFDDEFGSTLNLFEPRNVEDITTVQGIETDLQLNFRFLPKPFDGILLSGNFTLLQSATNYPFLVSLRNPTRLVEEVREAPLVGQPNSIWNLSLGYEKGGFTGRFSVVHQDLVIDGIAREPQTDTFEGKTTRFDLTFKQAINDNLKLYVNFNNITNQAETQLLTTDILTNTTVFGATADFGFQLRF